MMRQFLTILKMDLRNLFTNPVLIGFNTIFIFLIILILGFLSSGTFNNPIYSYQYYFITLIVFGILNGALTATNIFMERDIKGPNLRIIFSPVGSFPIYFSKIISSALFDYILRIVVIVFTSKLINLSLGMYFFLILIIMIPLDLCSAALGVLFCCIFKNEETSSTLLSNFISLLAVLGGTFFPLEKLGKVFSITSQLSPVKWINDIFFMVMVDNDPSLFLPTFISSIFVFGFLVLLCMLFFRKEDYL